MTRFSIENEGVERRLVYRLEADEYIDSFSYSMMTDNDIKGLLPIIASGMNGIRDIRYDIRSKVSLRSYMESSLSKKRLLDLFCGITDVVSSVTMYLLDCGMLVFDLDSIFIDGSQSGVYMVYLPIAGREYSYDDSFDAGEMIRSIFRTVMISARFIVEQDNTYITELLNELNIDQEFSINNFRELLDRLRGCSLNQTEVGTGVLFAEDVSLSDSSNNDSIRSDPAGLDSVREDNARSGVIRFDTDYSEKKNVSDNIISFPQELREELTEQACYEPESSGASETQVKGIVYRFTSAFKGLFKNKNSYESDNKVILLNDEEESTSYYDVDAKPAVVMEDCGDYQETVLLRRTPRDKNIPYLTRVSTGEMIGIDKEQFRIGKDERFADYRITDNAAISRAHAEITILNGVCYISDEESLNHTFVNGRMLEGGEQTELKSGDEVRFADEEYIFHC